jgi:hypothetical protein
MENKKDYIKLLVCKKWVSSKTNKAYYCLDIRVNDKVINVLVPKTYIDNADKRYKD